MTKSSLYNYNPSSAPGPLGSGLCGYPNLNGLMAVGGG